MGKAVTVRDVDAEAFVVAYANHLKRSGKIALPKWVDLVKTSSAKELAPYDQDWFYHRAAACARRVYMRKGLGVGALRRAFGERKNNGMCPEHHHRAGGNVIRTALSQLEAIGVIEKVDGGKGRQITRDGQRDLDSVAAQVAKQ